MVSETNEREVEGCLSVQPQSNPVDGFEEYFLGLNVENNKRNPWFTGTKSIIQRNRLAFNSVRSVKMIQSF